MAVESSLVVAPFHSLLYGFAPISTAGIRKIGLSPGVSFYLRLGYNLLRISQDLSAYSHEPANLVVRAPP